MPTKQLTTKQQSFLDNLTTCGGDDDNTETEVVSSKSTIKFVEKFLTPLSEVLYTQLNVKHLLSEAL